MTMKKILFTLATLALAGSLHAGDFPEISVADLDKALEARKVTVIDVNGTDSWKQGHVPGAIDFETNKDKLAKLLPKEKDALIVAYCGGPQCGAYQAAAQAAKDLGYTNVKHLKAGISGWKAANRKVEKS
jgi:rhodanese-related sulfurtransferase